MRGLTARDVMNRDVLTVPPDLTVHELAVFLVEHQISGAPVADERGKLLGLVSLTDIAENDALRAEAAEPVARRARRGQAVREDVAGLRVRRADLLVRDIMTPAAFAVPEDTPVAQVAQTMVAGRIHRLLVTRDHGMVGIVTSLDLLSLMIGKPTAAPRRSTRRARSHALLGALLLSAATVGGCSSAGSDDTTATVPAVRPAAAQGASSPELPPGHPPLGQAAAAEAVSGTVTLATALGGQVTKGAALFLIARAGKEGRIVAVRKEDQVTFPHAFELSAQHAMTHGAPFGGVLEITARLSRSGDAAPAPGDLEGHAAGVAAGSRGVRVELDTVRR